MPRDAAEDLAQFAADLTFERLPGEVVATLKRIVLDTIGTTLAGATLGLGCRELVAVVQAGGGAPESTLLGYRYKGPVPMIALANGAMAHALNYDDVYPGGGHLGVVTFPAALAMAERRGGCTGAELLTALAAGAEIALDGAAGDIVAQLREATGGGPRAVIDFVGASATAALGTAVLPRGGRYVICGLFGGELSLALPFLPLRAISVIGSFTGSLAEMKALLAVMKTGRVAPLPVEARPLAAVNEALDDLRAGRISGRIVLAQ